MLLLRTLIIVLVGVARVAATTSWPVALPGCDDKCGNVSIPYPFGIGTKCSLLPGFDITCNSSYNPPKPFTGNLEIIDISLNPAQMRIYMYTAYNCFNQSSTVNATNNPWINLSSEYRFSDTRNKFTALGCETLAYINGQGSDDFATGCASFCSGPESGTNGSCTGIGCCQTSIPKDLHHYYVTWGFNNNTRWDSVPCSYAMLVDAESYNFSTTDLSGFEFYKRNETVPLVLDWAFRNDTCQEAKGTPDYVCRSNNSDCYSSINGPGYLCSCLQGYEGNPYLEHGCIDINECDDPKLYPCHGICTNKQGSYDCTCPPGTKGNATISGSCTKVADKFPLAAKITVGISAGIVVLLALLSLLLVKLQKRKYLREKAEYVRQNGGLILYEKMRSTKVDTVRVFTEDELQMVTNNFDEKRILGTGGRGNVYKGKLEDGREVAIKKSKGVDENQEEEFANEIIILSQINHRSVVRLLGCCLEVPVPMLVYEFVPNGTLFDFLHRNISAIPLDIRLEIAVDSADALAYLHSSTAHSIIHGDVKSLNILLGANYKAKVSDLGASTLVPLDKEQLVELVQGTIGYLDPECISTRQLTEKSDVYSFGVVLLELITRKPAIYTDASNETRNLASSFVSVMNQNKLRDILDDQIVVDGGVMELLQDVAELALRCVSLKREERPTMKEVAEGLQILARFKHHPWPQKKLDQETESLLGHEISAYATTSTDTTAYNSVGNRLALDIDGGR
ncbi:wall-associated receptor kinase 3-like [Typha latifolia]|uniref:wall-associated receptor kinase 3-like n=1 Tax=Typha latifolia TaxID=4733 RepID=UPI003C2E580B